MVKYRMVTAVVVFFTLLLLPVLFVSCQDEDQATKTVDGRVISVDPQNSKISINTIEEITFSVSSETEITNDDGFDIQLSAINPGNYVMVGYYDDASGKHIASSINVEYNK